MAFCSNCGTKMDDGTKFCPSCGTPAGGGAPVASSAPATEKVGNIRKCPSCGAAVPSMTAVCPECGHEFNSVKVSDAVQKFVDQINALDAEIAQEKSTSSIGKRGWSNWGIGKKIGWVILNIYTMAIPLIISTLRNVFSPVIPPLLPSEQKKKSLIENFIVPNNREDIMEFVLFSSSKVEMQMSSTGTSLKLMAAAKKKTLIKNLSFAAVILIVVGLIVFNVFRSSAAAAAIEVPSSAVIAARNVSISGPFDGYFNADGDGLTMKSSADGTEIRMLVDIKAIKDFTPVIEKQFAEISKAQGWKEDDRIDNVLYVGSNSSTGIKIVGAGLDGVNILSKDDVSIINSLLKMEPGTTKRIELPVSLVAVTKEGKKNMAVKLMEREDLELYVSLQYRLTNNTLKDSGALITKYEQDVDIK